MSLLALDGVSVSYAGLHALERVSLGVEAGEIVALVGRSGSGKSTALAAALGLLPVHASVSGEVRLDGRALTGLAEHELERLRGGVVGTVFQEPADALDPLMTIGAQVAEVIRAHRPVGRGEARALAAHSLARVGLDPGDVSPARFPHQLSGGQLSRAQVALAIAAGPRLLLADEPTASLDAVARAELLALLTGLVRADGMGLLLVSHDLEAVLRVADRILVLDAGRVVDEGSPARLLGSLHPATRALLGVRPPVRRGTTESAPILEVRDLTFRRRGDHPDTPAVAEMSFAIARGETVAVVGRSGAGKSTLVRLLLGLETADAGAVVVDGIPLGTARGASLRAIRRAVQAVFQHPHASLDPRMTVGASVAEPLRLLDPRPGRAEADARVERALADVGLPPGASGRLPHAFSGGERQRIAIARALVTEPRLLLLDEPTSALDPNVRDDILALLAALRDRRGTAILLVTHDLALARGFADRVVVIDGGRIVEVGETQALLSRPQHPATMALVAASQGFG